MIKLYGILFFALTFSAKISHTNSSLNLQEECLGEFRKIALDTHNEYRKMHDSSSLEQHSAIDESAQKYAIELAKNNKFEHSKNLGNTGENLFAKYSNEKLSLEACQSIKLASLP